MQQNQPEQYDIMWVINDDEGRDDAPLLRAIVSVSAIEALVYYPIKNRYRVYFAGGHVLWCEADDGERLTKKMRHAPAQL